MMPFGVLKQYTSTTALLVRLYDVFFVALGSIVAFYLQFEHVSLPATYQITVLLAILITVILFTCFRVYQSWRGQDWLNQVRIVSLAWFGVVFLLIIIGYLTKTIFLFSHEWIVAWLFASWTLLLLFRFSLSYFLRFMRSHGRNHKKFLIIGAGDLGRKVALNIKQTEWSGIDIVAFLDDNSELHDTYVEDIKVTGGAENLHKYIDKGNSVDEIWLALPLRAENKVKEILYQLRHSTATVRFVPDIFGLAMLNQSVVEIAGLPVINLSESPMYGINRLIKGAEDRLLALFFLMLISPLMLLIAVGVKLSSPGPVFYRQERVSWNGKAFYMLKFRSMPVNAEQQTGATWAKPNENRATKLGAFLRKTSLDELPQFIDVLKGSMSIVGPRPERPVFVEKFKEEVPHYMKKHMVKGGITGWAQVNGWRGNTDLHKRIEHDIYYINNWSLWFDIKIILLTLRHGVFNRNAY